MSDYHRPQTRQKSRRDRRCICCYGPISKGEVYTQHTGFFEGSAYRSHYHNECWDALIEDGTWEFTPGEGDLPERLRPEFAAIGGSQP